MSGHPAPLGDDDLGRLISEGLHRDAARPVDESALVSGARGRAVRIRRRRSVVTTVAAVVLIGVPVGTYGVQALRTSSRSMDAAGSSSLSGPLSPYDAKAAGGVGADSRAASSGEAAASVVTGGGSPQTAIPVPGPSGPPQAPAGSPPAALSSGPAAPQATTGPGAPLLSPAPTSAGPATRSSGSTAALQRTPAGAVAIPDAALLTGADLLPATGGPLAAASHTRNVTPAPGVTGADVCGAAPAAPAVAGSRAATFQRTTGGSWTAATTVRVYAGTGAAGYLHLFTAQSCLRGVTVDGSAGRVGHGTVDAQGRTHWFAVAAVGRTVTEVRLVTPRGTTTGEGVVVGLLSDAVGRLGSSGLAGAASSDPGLR